MTTTGCDYVFDSDTNGENMAPVKLDCKMTNNITISGGGCTIDIGDTHPEEATVNQSMNGVSYENSGGSPGDLKVKVKATVTGIAFRATNLACGLVEIPKGTYINGAYNGTSTVRGYKAGTTHNAENQVTVGIK